MECRVYAVIVAYASSSKPLPTFIRKLSEAGARVVGLNEELRRVVAMAPAESASATSRVCEEFATSSSWTVKAVCSGVDVACVRERLLKTLKARAWSRVYYLTLPGSMVAQVEVKSERVVVKLGRGSLVLPPPPSLFTLSYAESEKLLSRAEDVLKLVVNNCSL
ncbi:MAG: hypothetical protein QXS85_05035 [Acidilobaceae archaeon]